MYRTEYHPSLLNYKEDFCKLVLKKSNPIFTFFGGVPTGNDSGNLFDPCPLKGRRYEKPKLTTTWIGTLVPTGEWRSDFKLTKVIDGVEEHILTISLYVLIEAKDAIGAEEF